MYGRDSDKDAFLADRYNAGSVRHRHAPQVPSLSRHLTDPPQLAVGHGLIRFLAEFQDFLSLERVSGGTAESGDGTSSGIPNGIDVLHDV